MDEGKPESVFEDQANRIDYQLDAGCEKKRTSRMTSSFWPEDFPGGPEGKNLPSDMMDPYGF